LRATTRSCQSPDSSKRKRTPTRRRTPDRLRASRPARCPGPTIDLRLVLITTLAAACVTACTVPAERAILDQFFAAARLRDNTALRRLATTTFEPLERGIVVDFEIANVASDRSGLKNVTITAPVRLSDGRVEEKTLIVTLQQGVLKDDAETARRWIVTDISERPSGQD
jgi:hypothetical protein